MAIYHHSVSLIKRSAGKSAVAAAAYRSGQRIADERTGIIHDYTRKTGIDHSEILTPYLSTIDTSWLTDRAELWNKVEAGEKRYDARVARQVTLAIPRELDRDNQIALVRDYVQKTYIDSGMIADINFHDLQSSNPHCHVMLTTRSLIITDGRIEFGNKNRQWDSRTLLLEQRQNWETLTNEYLADAGYDQVKIDCRSLEAQGVNRIPQIHLGTMAASMRTKNIPSRIGDEYDRIEATNNNIKSQLESIYNDRSAITDLDRECKKLNQQISDLQAEINQDAFIFASIAQQKTDKITKPLTSETLIEMIGGDDRAKRVVEWCRQNLIIPDGQTEFKRESNSITQKVSAVQVSLELIDYIFMDTITRKKTIINCCKDSGEILAATGVVTGAIVNLISILDNQMLMQTLRNLSKTKTQAQAQAEPEIDKVEASTTPTTPTRPITLITQTTLITPNRVVPTVEIETTTALEQVITKTDTPETTTASEQVITKTDRKTTPRRRSNELE